MRTILYPFPLLAAWRLLTICLLAMGVVWVFAAPARAALPVKLVAVDGAAGDRLGVSVALSGDTAIVGANRDDDLGSDSGAAYIYRWNGSGWTEEAKLTADDGAAGDQFGSSVALSGDTVVVGAPNDDDGGTNSGSAYIFVRTGSSWTQQAKLTADDAAALDTFGNSVAISGDTVVVGARGDADEGSFTGSVYVFVRAGSSWTQQAKLTADDAAAFARVGESVAVSGGVAIVGASGANAGGTQSGAAYVFVRAGSSWTQQAKLIADDGAAGDELGSSVALDGDTAIVGAAARLITSSVPGSAYVFVRDGSSWTQQAKLTADDGAARDRFGFSVTLDGDTAIIGASEDDDAGTDSGSAYVFVRTGSEWIQRAKLAADDAEAGDRFGFSVALSGDTAIVGVPFDDDAGSDSGTARVFERIGGVWIGADQKVVAADGALNDQFGESVAIDGDTAIVGAVFDEGGGSAYVFVRDGLSWIQQAKLTADDGAAGDRFGESVAISGDTVIVGASLDDMFRGSAYVFVRSGSSWIQQAKLTASDAAANDRFGFSVALDGDTAIVGAIGGNNGTGRAYVFTRGGSVWTQRAGLTASDAALGDVFGASVAISGDTVIIGALLDDDDGGDSGSAYIFVGVGNAWTQRAKLTASDAAAGDQFGFSVALDGDTAIVGALFDRDAGPGSGSAYVFERVGTAWTQRAKLTANDGAAGDQFGISVALSGDTAVVGAFRDDTSVTNSGSAYVFVRNAASWTQRTKLTADDGAAGDRFGDSVALSGDTAIVGAPGDDMFTGSAWLYSVVPERFPALVVNDSRGSLHPTFSSAFGVAGPFDELIASPAAYWAEPAIDNAFTPHFIESVGSIRMPFGASLTLGPNTLMSAAPNRRVDLFGAATVRASASLLSGASMLIQNTLDLQGGLLAALDGVSVRGDLTGFGDIQADLTNDSAVTVQADMQVVGDYTNNGTTTIQNGVLTVLGALTDNGTIVGDFPTPRSSGGFFVEDDYSAGAGSTLALLGGVARFGADFDVAINESARYDMAMAELRMVGLAGSTQTLERMSVDIGPSADGLDRLLPGHYPIGTLRIGPTATTVTLVDIHDNDGQGQGGCEAVYVRHLIISAGATLITDGCPVYYETLTLDGAVDDPANLVRIVNCPGDANGDGVVNFADLNAVLASFGQSGASLPGDVNGDDRVDFADLNLVLSNFGVDCGG